MEIGLVHSRLCKPVLDTGYSPILHSALTTIVRRINLTFYLLPFIILINLLFPDEINYSTMIFGTENKKVIENIEIIEMKNNRLYYFHLDNFKRKHIGCSILNFVKLQSKTSEIIYQPECSFSKVVKRIDMVGIENIEVTIESEIELDEKQIQYNLYKKNPKTAVLISCFLPSLGHAYADNWLRGAFFLAGETTSILAGLFINIIPILACPLGDPECFENARNYRGNYIGNSLIFIVAPTIYIWEKIDAYKEVEKYNNRIYKYIFKKEPPSFSLNLQPTYQGANLTLAYKFD